LSGEISLSGTPTLLSENEILRARMHDPIGKVGAWLKTLRRRDQKRRINWQKFGPIVRKCITPHDAESRGALTDDDRLFWVKKVCVLPQGDRRRREEAELTDDDRFWIITLSYKSPVAAGGVGQLVFTGDRGYKVFKPLAETGEIRSIKNREAK